MSECVVLAFDIGASNGRGILGYYDTDNKLLRTEEVHRFSHRYIQTSGSVYWDYIEIYNGIIECLRICKKRGVELDCIGVDTWSQDYAYISPQGELMGAPRSYRDPINKTHGTFLEERLGLSGKQLYEHCGAPCVSISTSRQLEHDSRKLPELFRGSAFWVNMPYLFVYLLSGTVGCDATLLSIGGMLDCTDWQISKLISEAIGCESKIPPMYECGTIMAQTGKEVFELTGYDAVPIACVNGHDTSSAVSAIPERGEFLWVSSGTFGMLGCVTKDFTINDILYEHDVQTTPLGDGRACLMKGAAGMYYFQQCYNYWHNHGISITYEEMNEYAMSHESDVFFEFDNIPSITADMPSELRKACQTAGFAPPDTPGELYLAFANSLARLTAQNLLAIEKSIGKHFDRVYVMGGGSKADSVNARIVRECKKELYTGLTEASSVGNLLSQLVAIKAFSWQESAEVSSRSFPLRRFEA